MIDNKILAFNTLMQKELDSNADKGDWKDFTDVNSILLEIEWHKAKLLFALRENNKEKIIEYSADCANNYMFLLNALKLI